MHDIKAYVMSVLWTKIGYKLILLSSYPRYEGKANIYVIGTTYQHIQKDFECTGIHV